MAESVEQVNVQAEILDDIKKNMGTRYIFLYHDWLVVNLTTRAGYFDILWYLDMYCDMYCSIFFHQNLSSFDVYW